MISEIFRALDRIFQAILSMIGFGSSIPALDNALKVHIKSSNRTIPVDLGYDWSIEKVREVVAPQFGYKPNEIKIIFAGKELPDDLVLNNCDIGQHSFLHAVRIRVIEPSSSSSITGENLDHKNKIMDPVEEPVEEVGHGAGAVFSSHPGHSDYFVYCNQCQSLQEGKLRVRCSACQSGAYTVYNDPGSWDDVLLPQRVEGLCTNCETPQYASFYFKCSGHVTTSEDDSSPPLSQVKRNSDLVPCLACGDAGQVDHPVFIFSCSHVSCIECFKQYLFSRINSRQFTQDETIGYTLGCPVLCQNSFITDSHHFKLMGKHDYDRYQRFATEECLLQMGGILCPQPDCGMGIIPVDSNCNKIACLHGCGYVFCRLCTEGWHVGPCQGQSSLGSAGGVYSRSESDNYPIILANAAQAQWDDPTRIALRMTTKPCPKCRVATERSGGCMHMECTKCQFQWCWVCQTNWTRDCMSNHWFST